MVQVSAHCQMFRDGKPPTKWGQSLGGGEKIGRVFELHWGAWHPATLPPGVLSSHLSLPPNISSVLKSSRACYLLYRWFLSVFLMIEASTGNWKWFHHSRHLWLWPLSSCWQGFILKFLSFNLSLRLSESWRRCFPPPATSRDTKQRTGWYRVEAEPIISSRCFHWTSSLASTTTRVWRPL